MDNTWSQKIERYLSEGRTVSGGCGPSSAMKNLNSQIQSFSGTMVTEANQIFGDVSGLFQSLKGSLDKVVAAGIDQQGWGAAESNAVTSQIMDQAAADARNEKAAAGNAISAIGGGNAVTPSGLATAVTLSTNQAVEAAKSQQLEQATFANYQQGQQNYFNALGEEEKLPSMLTVANDANKNAMSGLQTAQTSQASMDTAKNWWQPLVMSGIGAAASFATAGLSNLDTEGTSTAGEQAHNFLSGGLSSLCWIAAATFGGWDDPRTHEVRAYLIGPFSKNWYGRAIVHLYRKFGRRLASSKIALRILRPFIYRALNAARRGQ